MIAAENITEPLVAFNTDEEKEFDALKKSIDDEWELKKKEMADIEKQNNGIGPSEYE